MRWARTGPLVRCRGAIQPVSSPESHPSPMSAYSKLRRRQQLFVDAYVKCGVGSEAAATAGYSGKRPDRAAEKLFAQEGVKEAIAERTEQAIARAGVRHVRVLEE